MTQNLKTPKENQTNVKRESKSFEAIQQGTVIALLNTYGFGFEFKRPERIAEKTIQFLIVEEVFYNGKPLDFGKKITQYCDEQFQAELDERMSINQIKSLKRRRDLNRAALSFNWLIEYVQQFGYVTERRSTKSAKKTLQMEKINKIYKRNGYYLTQTEILAIGKEMNSYIISQFVKHEKTAKIKENDTFCLEMMKKFDKRTNEANQTQKEDATQPPAVQKVAETKGNETNENAEKMMVIESIPLIKDQNEKNEKMIQMEEVLVDIAIDSQMKEGNLLTKPQNAPQLSVGDENKEKETVKKPQAPVTGDKEGVQKKTKKQTGKKGKESETEEEGK